ncbi:MAG: hypothetical protein MRY76_15575 [Pseudomonadales bacterium]|nr:hypothetical protein [Pseudomonadales bacterium]
MTIPRALSALLLISAILLISLAPGGPIETRDFSHIPAAVLALFNVFLTVLGLGSILLAWLLFSRQCRWYWPFLAGASYFLVYGLDLLTIFPESPTAMNQALWAIEVAGMIVALPVMILSGFFMQSNDSSRSQEQVPVAIILGAGLAGLVIVAFTTISAMGG